MHRTIVRRQDDVAPLKPLACCIGVLVDRGNDKAPSVGICAQLACNRRGQGHYLQAEILFNHFAVTGDHVLFRLGIGVEHLALAQFLLARTLADRHIESPALSIAQDDDRDHRAWGDIRDKIRQRLVGRNIAAVDRQHDVARFDASAGRSLARLHHLNDLAAIAGQAKRGCQVVRYRLDLDTQIATLDLHTANQLVDNRLGRFGRNGKADADAAAGRRNDGIVDADHITLHVEQRTAGIASVDAGIRLEVAIICAAPGVTQNTRDDTARDGTAKTEGVADRDDPVANARLGGIAETHEGEGFAAVDLEHSQVRLGIGPHEFRLVFIAVRQGYRDFGNRTAAIGAYHMIVGDHVPIGRNKEARA